MMEITVISEGLPYASVAYLPLTVKQPWNHTKLSLERGKKV